MPQRRARGDGGGAGRAELFMATPPAPTPAVSSNPSVQSLPRSSAAKFRLFEKKREGARGGRGGETDQSIEVRICGFTRGDRPWRAGVADGRRSLPALFPPGLHVGIRRPLLGLARRASTRAAQFVIVAANGRLGGAAMA